HPVGTGPFMFESQVTGDSVVLVRNPAYWAPGQPAADRVVFRIIPDTDAKVARLLAGELDSVDTVTPQPVDQIRSSPGLELSARGIPFNIRIYFNSARAPFSDLRLRKAVDAAIARTAAARVAVGECAAPAPGPSPGVGEVPAVGPDLARQLVDAAGGLSFSLLVNAD